MGLVYILPWLIGMVFLTLYPFINALVISFTDYNLVREPDVYKRQVCGMASL